MVEQGAGRGNGKDQRADRPRSTSDIFAYGLSLVGFGEDRQKCSKELSLQRFRAHFGVDPKTIKKLVHLLTLYCPGFVVDLMCLFMAICWLRLYETESVMAGRWKRGEKFCRNTVRQYVLEIKKLKPILINFNGLSKHCKFAPVDGKHVPCFEFRCNPDSKWWSHKYNGPAVGFEVVTDPTDKGLMLWVSRPHPAGTHDLTVLRGGTKKIKKLEINFSIQQFAGRTETRR